MIALRALLLELVLAVLFSASASAANDSWPEFRGPAGQGLSTATNVPVHWSPTEGITWTQEIPGTGWSSPVLVDGRLYLTTAVTAESGDVSLRALCVDAADGKIVWDVEAIQGAAADAKLMHEKNSLASPTPIVADGRVYVHFGHMGTAALDLKGNVLWRQTELKYRPMHGNGGSPALVGDLLIFSCDGEKDPFLAAIDRGDGRVVWRQPRDVIAKNSFSFSTPLSVEVDGAQQLISAGSGYVGAYSPKDGQEIWRVTYGDGYSVIPRPVFSHGLLFVCSGYNKAQLFAIDPAGAKGDATATNVRWQTDRGVSLTPSVLVVGDELYYVADNGTASCVDAATGEAHWSKRLGGEYSASPVYADGRIYFLSEAGVASVIKAGTEYELLATNDMEERALASPAVADGAIYLRTQSHLWRVGE